MRKLILLLALSISPALAGNAPVASCTPGTTTAALATPPAPGNLIIYYNYRSNSATAPGTPSGFTVLKSETGSTNALKLSWKWATGNEATLPASSNATQSTCEVYSGNWITAGTLGGPFGNATSGATGTATPISYGTFTLTNPLSSSWVVCAAGAVSATNADTAPTGMTLRSGTTDTNIALSDTNGIVSTWSTQTVAINAGGWASACFELVGTPSTVTPLTSVYLVREINYGITREGTTTSDYHLNFPVPSSLANNFLMLHLDLGYGTLPTISNIYCNSDTGHATWTWTTISLTDATDTTSLKDFYIANAPAGCTSITVVPSGAWTNAAARYRELRQIATSTPVDTSVTLGAISNGIYVSAGPITPTQTGDIILQDCTSASMAGPTGGSASTGTFYSGGVTALDLFPINSLSASGFVYGSTSAVTVYHAMVGSSPNSACIAVALKASAAAGTAPTGPTIVGYWDQSNSGASFSMPMTNLQSGDAMLVVANGYQAASAVQFTGLTDVVGDSFTVHDPSDANGGYPNIGLDCDITSGNNLLSFTGVNTNATQHLLYIEMSGLANSSHTACYDSTAGTPVAHSTGSVTTASDMPGITPSTSSGFVFGTSEMGTGTYPMSQGGPACGQFFVPQYPGQTDASTWGLGNMFGICANTSTSAQNWSWTNGSSTAFQAIGIALEAASGASTNPVTGLTIIIPMERQ